MYLYRDVEPETDIVDEKDPLGFVVNAQHYCCWYHYQNLLCCRNNFAAVAVVAREKVDGRRFQRRCPPLHGRV